MSKKSHYQEQTIGAVVDVVNQERVYEMNACLLDNLKNQESLLHGQDERFLEVLKEVNSVRDFVDNPQKILGSDLTKHGEVAESLEVHIRNAQDVFDGNVKVATFEGVGRTAPEDYLIDGIDVQSKFYNGINNTLNSGILKHMENYENFGRDGSFYHIPKDQYEIIEKVMNGEFVDGLAPKTINSITKHVSEIELKSGHDFADVVKPSISNYDEVQLGVVHKTIDGHEELLEFKHEEIKDSIIDDAEQERVVIKAEHQPSLGEALNVMGIGAVLGGTSSVVLNIYQKHKENKPISSFSSDDWKSVGVDFSKGATKGAVTGGVIYGLTNYCDIGAPVASAMVSASFGIAKLSSSYNNGEISQSEYINQGQLLCINSGAVALGATAGQVLIPIPIVGAVVGTCASKVFMELSSKHLAKMSDEIQKILDKEYSDVMAMFDKEHQAILTKIVDEYERVGGIMKMAFDFDTNNALLNLNASIELAEIHGVDEKNILRTIEDCDNYFLV